MNVAKNDAETPVRDSAQADPTSFMAMHIMGGAAKHAGATLDSISGWMLAGFGAVLGLILSQLQGLSQFLDPLHVRWAGVLFIVSMMPAFVSKILGAMAAASAHGASEGMQLGEKIAAWGPVDERRLLEEVAQGTQWPLTWLHRRNLRLALRGDFAGMGRLARDRSTMQIRLVMLQTLLTGAAGLTLILGLNGA